AYLIGRRFGVRAAERFFTGEKAKHRLGWAEDQLDERGGELIVVARFIPGGRTAVTLSAGTLGYPWRRFVVFDGGATLLWGSYSALLGYYGGKTFESFWGLLLALTTAFAVAGGIELVRWVLRRRRNRRSCRGIVTLPPHRYFPECGSRGRSRRTGAGTWSKSRSTSRRGGAGRA